MVGLTTALFFSIAMLLGNASSLSTKPFLDTKHGFASRIATRMNSVRDDQEVLSVAQTKDNMPELNPYGMYSLKNKEEHETLLIASRDKIVVLKYFAPWCRACKSLAPKYMMISRDKMYKEYPIVFAEMTVVDNKDFIKDQEVFALPTIQIFVGSDVPVCSFPCGPSKVTLLKRKLVQVINENVDSNTGTLKNLEKTADAVFTSEAKPSIELNISLKEGTVTDAQINLVRVIPFFQYLGQGEFDGMMEEGKLVTFEPESIILKENMSNDKFYVVVSGEVERSVRLQGEGEQSNNLGTIIDSLKEGDYFGERSVFTGQVQSSSVRAVKETSCFMFTKDAIPSSSPITSNLPPTPKGILPLLIRFKQARQVAKCFDYIASANLDDLNNPMEQKRRSLLVSKLQKSQYDDFSELFQIIDHDNSGYIDLIEMRRFMTSIGEEKSDRELADIIEKSTFSESKSSFTFEEFMGVMAEAEFYYLFMDTFNVLDKQNSGFVSVMQIENVLGGVRDLISNERLSLIDVEDKEMLIDYERFSKMLLGV